VLRENRRVVKDTDGTANRQEELESFHHVLLNISEGKATQRVRDYILVSRSSATLDTNAFAHSFRAPFTHLPRIFHMETKDFIIKAYVRGAISCGGCIERVGLEGSTAAITSVALIRCLRSCRWCIYLCAFRALLGVLVHSAYITCRGLYEAEVSRQARRSFS